MAVSIYIPTSNARGFPFFMPSPAFTVCRLFDDGHFDWCDVVSHCSFDLHFSNNERCWASFHVLAMRNGSLGLLWRNVYLGLFPTFWLGCLFFWYWVVWATYIFWKLILSVVSLAIIFSHSEGCLFTLLIVFFAVQKLLHFKVPFWLFWVLFPLL